MCSMTWRKPGSISHRRRWKKSKPKSAHWAGRRPWGWWAFDAAEQRDESRSEVEQLDDLGALSAAELAILKERHHEGHVHWLHRHDMFRRPWSWWKFSASEPRNRAESEAAQLVRMGCLNEREQFIFDHKAEHPDVRHFYRGMLPEMIANLWHLELTAAERSFLGLPPDEPEDD